MAEAVVDKILGVAGLLAGFECGGFDLVLLHELFGEDFGAFELGGFLASAEDADRGV